MTPQNDEILLDSAPLLTTGKTWTVTSTSDANSSGTLRYAINNAANGDVISFSSSLKGKTITLSNGSLQVTKSITIDATSIWDSANNQPGITINANKKSTVFYVTKSASSVAFKGLKITGGVAEKRLFYYLPANLPKNSSVDSSVDSSSDSSSDSSVDSSVDSSSDSSSDSSVDSSVDSSSDPKNISDSIVRREGLHWGKWIEKKWKQVREVLFPKPRFNGDVPYSFHDGGGVFSFGSNVSFTNCVITGNQATSKGGGVYFIRAAATFTNCTIFNNSASTDGGAATFTKCVISGNKSSKSGGGVCARGGSATFTGCTISDNKTTGGSGGGVYASNDFSATFTNCAISNNSASTGGGGVFAFVGTLTNCKVTGNTSGATGGGVDGLKLILMNCEITNNSASTYGGGVHLRFESPVLSGITNCTISGNKATKAGGGLYASVNSKDLTVTINFWNTILALNEASSGADFASGVGAKGGAVKTNARNTLSTYTSWTSGANNLAYDSTLPLFENASARHYELALRSQALDKGDNAYVHWTYDLANSPRIVGIVDLGAYESQEAPSTVVTTLADVVSATDNKTSLREALRDASDGDVISFDPSLAGGTITLSLGALEISKNVTINASAFGDATAYFIVENNQPGITIDANLQSRVFYVDENSTVSFKGLAITGGSADVGGGVYVDDDADATFINCSITGNSANSGGGVGGTGAATFENCSIASNSADASGGAVMMSGAATFENCSIKSNSAEAYGGGVMTSGDATFINCAITGNSAYFGGGVYVSGGSATFVNCTISANVADSTGGGVYATRVAAVVSRNTIVALNAAPTGEDVCALDGAKLTGYNTLSTFSGWTSGSSNYVYKSSLPLFANAAVGDFLLAPGSQALDKGKNAYAVDATGAALESDLAGRARVYNGTVDLGAYEYSPKEAASTVVTTSADVVDAYDGAISLREALAYALDGDVVSFAPSLAGAEITLSLGQLRIHKNLTIDASALWGGATNQPGMTIDGKNRSRVFYVDDNLTVSFTGLAIKGGKASGAGGGGVYVSSGAVATFANCAIFGNKADYGGGVWVTGSATFDNCAITENTSQDHGGGVFVDENSSATFAGCMIAENKSTGSAGGGVWVKGSATFASCTISDNTASSNGGGVCFANAGTLTSCKVTGNKSSGNGGGVYGRSLTLTNCEISGNEASYGGGVRVYCESSATSTITNCTISGNKATQRGGGLYVSVNSQNSTVNINLRNTILALNTASTGADLSYSVGANGGAVKTDARNTLSSYSSWTTGSNKYAFNSSQLLFANAAEGDYSLAPDSQALDKGANAYAVDATGAALESDLSGRGRIYNRIVDLGAYEYFSNARSSGETPEAPSTVVTTSEDVVDAYDDLISLREALEYASDGDDIYFAPSLAGKTITLSLGELKISKDLTIDASELWNAKQNKPGMTIDAEQKSRVFYVDEDLTVSFNGLEITGGSAVNAGGGVYASSGVAATFGNCIILANKACDDENSVDESGFGGGVYLEDGSATFDNCFIANNLAEANGGGVYVGDGSATFTNCIIASNDAEAYGGGVYASGAATFANCLISINLASKNYYYYGSYIGAGGGVCVDEDGAATFVNCTVSGNTAINGGGINVSNGGTVHAENTIVVSNFATTADAADAADAADVCLDDDSTIEAHNTLSSFTAWTFGSNNYVYDASQPLFANADDGDYALAAGSQAIDKGDVAYIVDETGAALEYDISDSARVYNGLVDLGAYEYQTPARPLSTPSLEFASSTSTSISVKWKAISGAKSYTLQYKLSSASSWTNQGVRATETSYTVAGLTPDASYDFRLRANGDGGATWYSSNFSAVVAAKAIAKLVRPELQLVGSTNSSITLDWSAISGAKSYTLQYKLSSDSSWTNQGVRATETSYTVSGLTPDASYDFRLRANGDGGATWYSSDFSAVVAAKAIAKLVRPELQLAGSTNSSITLDWSAISGAKSYTLQYKLSSDSSWTNQGVRATETSYTVSGLTPDASYDFRLRANGDGGATWYSSDFSGVLTAPAVLTSSPLAAPVLSVVGATSGAISLSWSEVANASSYTIEYKLATSSDWTTTSVASTSTSATLTDLTPGGKYNVRMVAVGDGVEFTTSDYSATLTQIAASKLATPVLKNAGSTPDSIVVAWQSVEGAKSYTLQYKLSSDSSWTNVGIRATETSKTLSGLTPGGVYQLQLRANGDGGATWLSSAFSAKLTATAEPKLAPPQLVATSTENAVALAWQTISGAKSYTLQYKLAEATSWTNVGIRATETSYTVSNLASGTYDFRLRANGDGGATWKSSDFSEICSTTLDESLFDEFDAILDTADELEDEFLTALAENWN